MTAHALYRFYDHAGELLYIGIARDPAARWRQHAADKRWWHEVQRIAIQTMPDRKAALKAERSAIEAEKPRYNLAHNRPEPPTPPPSADEKTDRLHARWRFVAMDWKTVTGEELPHCDCCLPDGQSCGDFACVLAITALADGAIRGRDEVRKWLGYKAAASIRKAATGAQTKEVP